MFFVGVMMISLCTEYNVCHILFFNVFLSNKNCDLQLINNNSNNIIFNFLMLHQNWQSAARIFSQICLQDKFKNVKCKNPIKCWSTSRAKCGDFKRQNP
jgi:hypothetical protein